MKFTLSWLQEFLDTNLTIEQISEKLTSIGLEVEEITNRSKGLENFSIAEIVEAIPHPNADKLRLCKVNTGSEILDIVCGAPNARKGIKVVLAKIGSVIPTNGMVIKASEIRGHKSNGMLCSERELGLGSDHDGIIELEDNAVVGESFVNHAKLDDPIIEIALTPNRGDCLGVYGIARDLAAAGGGILKPLKIKEYSCKDDKTYKIKEVNDNISDQIIFTYIDNIKNTQSPKWLIERLKSIGLKPISALVDITNYISYCFARPSHVYDCNLIGKNISVRFANDNEKILGLDDNEYNLNNNIMVIADENNPIAIAGIIGSKNTGCSFDTKSILLEVADFNPILIAKNGRKLNINTDARYRFERNIDKSFLETANNILINLIIEICGGEVNQIISKINKKFSPTIIDFDFNMVKKLSGINIDKTQAQKILKDLGCTINDNKIIIPSWRNDITIAEDLVEEIVRIYGYDNLEVKKLPPVNYINPLNNLPKINASLYSSLRKNLTSRGLFEVLSFSFTKTDKLKYFAGNTNYIEITNPISTDLSVMRKSIIPNLLDIIDHNVRHGINDLGIFELGPKFLGINPEDQEDVVVGLRAGNMLQKNIFSAAREFDLWDVKADLLSIIEELGFNTESLSIAKDVPNYYHPGKSGALIMGKIILGYFGELHPKIIKDYGFKDNVKIMCFETTDLNKYPVKNKKNTQKPMVEISDFPMVSRDLAFLFDKNITAEQIVKTISSTNREVICDINIFDVYSGDKIASDKKSIAISFKLKPKHETLKDEEINNIINKIIYNIQNKFNATLRM